MQATHIDNQIDNQIVKNLIDSDLHNSLQLYKLLSKEKKALENRDNAALQSLLDEKQQIIEMLERNDHNRRSLLTQGGQQDTTQNWRNLVRQLKLEARWLQLEKQLKRCRELNRSNELIVARSQQVVGRLLEVFRGQYGQTGVYNEKGSASTRSSGISRTITTA